MAARADDRADLRAFPHPPLPETLRADAELLGAVVPRQADRPPVLRCEDSAWWYVISAESYVDRSNSTPDILELAPTITCPVLYLRGSAEPKHVYPAEAYAERAGGPCEVAIVEGDHFYKGTEDQVCGVVTAWLNRTLPGPT